MSSALLSTSLSLLSLQLFSRLFSFSLNQFLLRTTTPQALGLATITLDVFRDTSLFILRDGLRGAIIRQRSSSSSSPSAAFTRTTRLPALLSPLATLPFLLYSFYPPSPTPDYFYSTLLLYSISSILELASEQFYLTTLYDWESLTSKRVRVEGLAVVGKAFGTLGCIWLGGEKTALLSYGVGQVVYAAVLLVGLWWSTPSPTSTPTSEKKGTYYDTTLTSTSWALTKQSFIKQLLTEADKIAVGRLSKVEDQGGYAVALNYGSLIARILFQPLEETSRLFFSRTLSTPTRSSLLSSSSLLSLLLLLHSHLSLIFMLLAPSYTSPLLYHLLGPRWSYPLSSAPLILKAYCYYLPFLAINGITEAFFQSVAVEKELKMGSWAMGVSSVGFLGAVVVGRGFGNRIGWTSEQVLVAANCVNMSVRIGFASWFINYWFGKHLSGITSEEKEETKKNLTFERWGPKLSTLSTFLVSGAIVRWSEKEVDWKSLKGFGTHVAVGVGVGVVCLGVMYKAEKEAIERLMKVVGRKKVE